MRLVGKYLLRIFVFLAAIIALLNFHYDNLLKFFLTNQTLNSIIIFVITIGVLYILRQLLVIKSELTWLNNSLKAHSGSKTSLRSPQLLKYLDTYIERFLAT